MRHCSAPCEIRPRPRGTDAVAQSRTGGTKSQLVCTAGDSMRSSVLVAFKWNLHIDTLSSSRSLGREWTWDVWTCML